MLFIHDGADNHFALEARVGVGSTSSRSAHGGHATLHVGCAASIEPSISFLTGEWRMGHPVDVDHIEMTIQHQRSTTRRAASPRDDIWTTSRRFVHLDTKSPRLECRAERACGGELAGTVSRERRVSRIDADKITRKLYRIGAAHADAFSAGCSTCTPSRSMPNGMSVATREIASRTFRSRPSRAITTTQPPPEAPSAFPPIAPA